MRCSESKDWKHKLLKKQIGAIKPKGLHRIAKLSQDYPYLREENLSIDNYLIVAISINIRIS
jgi:hypothetical protein